MSLPSEIALIALALVTGWWLARLFGARRPREAATADRDGPADRCRTLEQEVLTFREVLDGLAEGVWITDARGALVSHNRALAALLNVEGELKGKRPLFLLRSVPLDEAVERALIRGESSELEILEECEPARTLSIHVAPLGKGRTGSVAVIRDVSALRRLEQSRKALVADVSHELRTPITAIRGYAETLRAGALADTAHAPAMVDALWRQSERLSRLIADLLDLSRLDAHPNERPPRAIALAPIASRATEGLAFRIAEKHLRFSCRVPDSLWALGEPSGLEQALVNLLENALRHTPEGGELAIEGTLEGAWALLAVRDSGEGIDPRHLPRLFERFYRADPGRSREMGGTGLGLAIVEHLVSTMQGEVRVASEPGKGSVFTLALRASRPEVGPPG